MTDGRNEDVEDVLLAFSVEPQHDRATLERYLRLHPALADDLIDLSLEMRLQRAGPATSAPVDEAWIEASLADFRASSPPRQQTAAVDPFAALSSEELVALRRSLDVPSGVIQGFRSRMVDIASVPAWFVAALAQGLRTGVDELRAFVAAPPGLTPGLSYKSDEAPSASSEKVSFEELLRQCRVPDEKRLRLLTSRD